MTLDNFRAAADLSTAQAERWYACIVAAFDEFDISSSERIAAFIGQTAHETLGFTLTRELWGPTPEQRAMSRHRRARCGLATCCPAMDAALAGAA